MKKNFITALKIFTAGIAVILISSCPSPITEALVAAVEDSFDPVITVTSPDYGSTYLSVVTITGQISDNAISQGDGKGSISALSFTAGSLNIYRGGIQINSEGQITKVPASGDVDISFDRDSGIFSFEVDSSLFRGPMQFEISATDMNSNSGTTTFLLYESGGPVVNLTSPGQPLYESGQVLHLEGTVGDSFASPDSIAELSSLEGTIPILGIYGTDIITLDIVGEYENPGSTITFHSDRLGGFDFVLTKATGVFTSDILIPGSVDSPINININVSDKNGHLSEVNKTLIQDTGEALMSLSKPTSADYYSPASTNALQISGFIDSGSNTVTSLTLDITSDNGAIPQQNIFSLYSPGTGSINGTVDLTSFNLSGNADCTIVASTSIGNPSDVSFLLHEDSSLPLVQNLNFSVGIDGNAYAHGGETANLSFTLSDSGSGIDTGSLNVSIGGQSVTATYNSGSGFYEAGYILPLQSAAAPLYDNSGIPFFVQVQDKAQNTGTVNQGDTAAITYYHKTPDTLSITLDNPINLNPRVADGEQIDISVPTTRNLASGAIDIIINGAPFNVALTDQGSAYEGSLAISSGTHSQGSVGYSFNYEDLAGNIGIFSSVSPLMYVDYTAPTLSSSAFTSTSGENWASDDTSDSLKVVFVLNDNIDGSALDDSNHSPMVTFTDSGSIPHNVTPVYSGSTWTALLPVTSGFTQGTVSAAVHVEDLAGNTNDIPFGNTITADTAGPDISIVDFGTDGISGTWAKKDEKIHLYFTLNDTVEGSLTGSTSELTAPAVTLTRAGGNTDIGSAAWSPLNHRWEITYTVPAGTYQGHVGYIINAVDTKGLVSEDSDAVLSYGTSTIVIDTIAPVFSVSSVDTDHHVSGFVGEEGVIVDFSMTEDNPGIPSVTFDGVTGSTVSAGGNTWQATHTVDFAQADGELTIAISFTDTAGNSGSASDTSLTVDKDGPVVTISSVSPSGSIVKGTPVTVVFSANDSVFGYVEDSSAIDVTFDSASVSFDNTAYNSGTHNWTVTYTPSAADPNGIVITVLAEDTFSNSGSAVNSDITEVTDS